MENEPSFKDRKKLNFAIKREFQGWLLRRVLVAVAVSAGVAALILYFYARQEVIGSFFDAHVKIRRVSDLLLPVVVAGSMVSLLVGVLLALFLPQKIAGPIYRIEQGLKKIAAGDLTTEIKLRDADTLKELAERVNQSTSALHKRVREVQSVSLALEMALAADEPGKVAELVQQQKNLLEKLVT